MSNAVIDVQDVHISAPTHFWQRPKTLLRGLTFQVNRGEIYGFIGPNGAGKTTTIKAMLGLLHPSRGRITVAGLPSLAPMARLRVGFLGERSAVSPHLCGLEQLMLHGRLSGQTAAQARKNSQKWLMQLGLRAAQHDRLSTYSKGMQQRLALAQALLHAPDLLILDEPMSGLDPQGRRDVREVLLAHAARGKTVFFSTHILSDVEMICHRVAIIAGGRLQHVGSLAALPGAAYEVWASDVSAALQARLRQGNAKVRQQAQAFIVECKNVQHANAVIDLLRGSGATVRALQSMGPSLETTYLHATGAQMVL